MLESFISNILTHVPVSWRRKIIGRPNAPNRVAHLAHRVLNNFSDGNLRSYPCVGMLDGYRMYIHWAHFRGFIYDSWEPTVVARAATEIKAGMTVIDIGAHIGYYTLLFAKCVGKTGRVIAFEPLPASFEVLKKNVELNELTHVSLFTSAIFSHGGELTISIPDHANSGEASVVKAVGAQQVQVRSTTLDAVCSTLDIRPDFVKIDVEGCESEVLAGAGETIGRCRPMMLIELHHFDGNLSGHPVPNQLTGMGYNVDWIERSDLTSHIFASHRR